MARESVSCLPSAVVLANNKGHPRRIREDNGIIITTMRFHIFAASATVVQTVLQPANSISFCGLLYNKLYMTLAPSPGSHWKGEKR